MGIENVRRKEVTMVTPARQTKDTSVANERFLTAEQEKALAEQIAKGKVLRKNGAKNVPPEYVPRESLIAGKEALLARDTLAAKNVRLMSSIASRFFNKGISEDDLLQEGEIELLKAAEQFDPEKGRFTTIASRKIFGRLHHVVYREGRIVHVSAKILDQIPGLVNFKTTYEEEIGKPPTNEELAKELSKRGLMLEKKRIPTESEIAQSTGKYISDIPLILSEKVLSLDYPVDEEGSDPLIAFIADETADTVTLALNSIDPENKEKGELLKIIEKSQKLTDRQKKLLTLEFFDELSPELVGKALGVTKGAVEKLQTRALHGLREELEENSTDEQYR